MGEAKRKAAAADAAIKSADRSHASDEQRLDTGMKVGEATQSAMLWWENTGRDLMRQARTPGNKGAAFFNPNPRTDREALNSFPSGIMAAKPWADLTREEKLSIVRAWHHNFVRIAQSNLVNQRH